MNETVLYKSTIGSRMASGRVEQMLVSRAVQYRNAERTGFLSGSFPKLLVNGRLKVNRKSKIIST